MTFLYRTNTFCLVLLFLTATLMAAAQEFPEFNGSDSLTTNDGHVRLDWAAMAPGAVYEVQQSTNASFENSMTIYEGADLATFVSGLSDGVYYYRFRANKGSWSETLTLTVKHYSLQLAFALAGLGAVVFLSTVVVILKGAAKDTHE